MSTVSPATESGLTERFIRFYRDYYRNDIGQLAQHYPREQRSLEIDYADLSTWDNDIAEDWLTNPEHIREYAEDALQQFDLPADVSLNADGFQPAHVRLCGLDETHYPRDLSPTRDAAQYIALEGEVAKKSDTFGRITEAAFECQRCGTPTFIPQGGTTEEFQEPHECAGCERQGPFNLDFDRSSFVDAQMLRLKDPPEVATDDGKDIDVYVEDDLAGQLSVGDRTTIHGVTHREQRTSGNQKTASFDLWLDGQAIDAELSGHADIEISSDERERIKRLASGAEGDPVEVGTECIAPKIYGYDHIKRALLLQMVSDERVSYHDGSADRGDIHVLILGDPSTAKSKLMRWVREVHPRSVGVSGKAVTEAGLLAGAEHDDFGDEGWTLSAGAFVQANGGMVCIDELDDMDPQLRAAMLEPMANQSIDISKIVDAELPARTAVLAVGNPKYGRFDPYEPLVEQFDFESNLLSRFDLIFTVQDEPDPDRDDDIAGHQLRSHNAAAKRNRGLEPSTDEAATMETPVEQDLFRKWIALAKREPSPHIADDALESMQSSFVTLRGANGYEEGGPVPVSFRNLDGIRRLAKAAARLELSEVVEQRHVDIATQIVGRSMQDCGKDEDGTLDTDVVETGRSMSQQERLKLIEETIKEQQSEHDDNAVPFETLYDALEDDVDRDTIDNDVKEFMCRKKGWAVQPQMDETVRWIGRR